MTQIESVTAAVEQSQCDELAAAVLAYCQERGIMIAASESLTGGLLADAFVRVPGASKVFLGSAVTYDIRAKASILGVDADLLRSQGAVHPEVARQMAYGTARLYAQPEYGDRVFGLSTTGVAGPGPDGDKPAGLVYVGFSIPVGFGERSSRETVACELRLQGTREDVRKGVVRCVLGKMRVFSGFSQE